MNGQGGSFIVQPNGELLQVEGPNMTDEQRAAAAPQAAAIIADAEAKAKAEEKARADTEGTPKAASDTPSNQGANGRSGRRQQSEE